MTLTYIRDHYKVNARRGVLVEFQGRVGKIVGARNQYLRVRFGNERRPKFLHPTWCIKYLESKVKP